MRRVWFDAERVAKYVDDKRTWQVSLNNVAATYGKAADRGHDFAQGQLITPAVRWISRDGNSVIVERPPSLIALQYNEMTFAQVPFPWTTFHFRFHSGILQSLAVKAAAAPIEPGTSLHRYPYPNTDIDGKVNADFFKNLAGRYSGVNHHGILGATDAIIRAYWHASVARCHSIVERSPVPLKAETLTSCYKELADIGLFKILESPLVAAGQVSLESMMRVIPEPERERPEEVPVFDAVDRIVRSFI